MKIEKFSEEKEKMKIPFLIKDINSGIANAIRRSVLEIPVLAIDTVEFYHNDSTLYDEVLAHRIGLVPLRTTKTSAKTSFKLKAKGPCTVYSKELKNKGKSIVVYPDMPLVLLAKDQELELSAIADFGLGKEHAKYTPGLIWYNSFPIVKINGCGEKRDKQEIINVCPRKAISLNGDKLVIDPLKCDMCNACVNLTSGKDSCSIKIEPSENDFIFFVESFGHLEPREIFIEAVKSMDKNLDSLYKIVNKFKK